MDYSILFVCLMGIGTVFIGLICIIILVSVMSSIVRKTGKAMDKRNTAASPAAPDARSAVPSGRNGEMTPELIAVISACIAENMGTDVSAIRIVSCRRV